MYVCIFLIQYIYIYTVAEGGGREGLGPARKYLSLVNIYNFNKNN
jgi:hypothetical protein